MALLLFARVDPAVSAPGWPEAAVPIELECMATADDIIADLSARQALRVGAVAGVRMADGKLLRAGEVLADAGVCTQSQVHVVLRLTQEEIAALNAQLVQAARKGDAAEVEQLLGE
eukprot:Hpha_TRINITY_DN6644_c0_g1::TRINITY_DN6644_c0_g1_i2::g.26530::m.26530